MPVIRSRGVASGTIADNYSKISGLSASLWAQKVRTAAVNGKTSAGFSNLINDLRGANGLESINSKDDGIMGGAAGADVVIVENNQWYSEESLANKIQELIKLSRSAMTLAAHATADSATNKLNILLPSVIMNKIPESVREELGYEVAEYLHRIRLALLNAAFPGAMSLLFKVAEHTTEPGGISHVDKEEILSTRK